MSGGWIKLNRTLLDHALWKGERYTKGQAWVDLIMLANYKPGFFMVRGNVVNVDRGQVGWSQRNLSKRWQWHRKTTKSFISSLSKHGMVTLQATPLTSIITICNYDEFQSGEQNSASQNVSQSVTQSRTQSVTQTTYKQEVKNKRKKELFTQPTAKQVYEYMQAQGCTKFDVAAQFVDHHSASDWHLAGNRKMKDWKAAARNWLRNEKRFNRRPFEKPENVVQIDPRQEQRKNAQRKELEEMLNGITQ